MGPQTNATPAPTAAATPAPQTADTAEVPAAFTVTTFIPGGVAFTVYLGAPAAEPGAGE